jgi:hypothetical protein
VLNEVNEVASLRRNTSLTENKLEELGTIVEDWKTYQKDSATATASDELIRAFEVRGRLTKQILDVLFGPSEFVPPALEEADLDCQDSLTFVDSKNKSCASWWSEGGCSDILLMEEQGYDEAGIAEVQSRCPKACQICSSPCVDSPHFNCGAWALLRDEKCSFHSLANGFERYQTFFSSAPPLVLTFFTNHYFVFPQHPGIVSI